MTRSWRRAVVVMALAAPITACLPSPEMGMGRAPVPEVIFRNQSSRTVWLLLDGDTFGHVLGSVPPHSVGRLRIPADVARRDIWVRLAVVGGMRPGPAVVIDEMFVPIRELRAMEWTLTGSVLTERPIRGSALAGGGS